MVLFTVIQGPGAMVRVRMASAASTTSTTERVAHADDAADERSHACIPPPPSKHFHEGVTPTYRSRSGIGLSIRSTVSPVAVNAKRYSSSENRVSS